MNTDCVEQEHALKNETQMGLVLVPTMTSIYPILMEEEDWGMEELCTLCMVTEA